MSLQAIFMSLSAIFVSLSATFVSLSAVRAALAQTTPVPRAFMIAQHLQRFGNDVIRAAVRGDSGEFADCLRCLVGPALRREEHDQAAIAFRVAGEETELFVEGAFGFGDVSDAREGV